jgi:hypothetical protein
MIRVIIRRTGINDPSEDNFFIIPPIGCIGERIKKEGALIIAPSGKKKNRTDYKIFIKFRKKL